MNSTNVFASVRKNAPFFAILVAIMITALALALATASLLVRMG